MRTDTLEQKGVLRMWPVLGIEWRLYDKIDITSSYYLFYPALSLWEVKAFQQVRSTLLFAVWWVAI